MITSLSTDIVVGFDEVTYTVGENEGVVTISVSVMEGELSGDTIVEVRPIDDTATCQH